MTQGVNMGVLSQSEPLTRIVVHLRDAIDFHLDENVIPYYKNHTVEINEMLTAVGISQTDTQTIVKRLSMSECDPKQTKGITGSTNVVNDIICEEHCIAKFAKLVTVDVIAAYNTTTAYHDCVDIRLGSVDSNVFKEIEHHEDKLVDVGTQTDENIKIKNTINQKFVKLIKTLRNLFYL